MFSYLGVATGQLSLLGWRTLTGLQVLWSEVLGHDIFIRELMRLYQLKKPKGPVAAYLSSWGTYGNLVRGDPTLKNGYKKGWFVAEGKWGMNTLCDDGNPMQVQNFFNEDCKYSPYNCLLFFIVIHVYKCLANLGLSIVW